MRIDEIIKYSKQEFLESTIISLTTKRLDIFKFTLFKQNIICIC